MKEILIRHSNIMVEQFIMESIESFSERSIFKKTLETNSNLVIIGLRRIGKTQLLKELTNKYNSFEDFYSKFSMDARPSSEDEILSSFKNLEPLENKEEKNVFIVKFDSIDFIRYLNSEEKIQEIFMALKEIIKEEDINLLLIDEIQVINKWTYYLKDIVDTFEAKKFRMIVTGSNSKELLDSSEIGIGRFQPKIFGVLSYNEAQIVHGDVSLAEYMNYKHFPHYDEKKYKEEVPLAIVEKAFSSTKNKKSTLYKVLINIIDNMGSETNQSKVAKNSEVNKTHIRDYISALKQSQLIFEVKNHNPKGNNSKFYPLIPGASKLFNEKNDFYKASSAIKGKLFECFALIQMLSIINDIPERLKIEYFRDKEGNEIDFIINENAIEVKHMNEIKNILHYLNVCKKQKFKSLNFIYLGKSKKEIIDGIKIKYINWREIDKYEFK